ARRRAADRDRHRRARACLRWRHVAHRVAPRSLPLIHATHHTNKTILRSGNQLEPPAAAIVAASARARARARAGSEYELRLPAAVLLVTAAGSPTTDYSSPPLSPPSLSGSEIAGGGVATGAA